MNKSIYVKLFVILIVLSHKKLNTKALDFGFDKLFGTSVCSLLSVQQLSRCSNHFGEEVQRARYHNGEYGRRVVCCAINVLKDCIVEAIGDKCGENQKKSSEAIVKAVVSGVKMIEVSEDCDGYFSGSPLCYSDMTLTMIAIGLAVILLFAICLCCYCCRKRLSRKRYNGANVVLLSDDYDNNRLSTIH